MKHLDEFFKYITESKNITDDDLEDILVPFSDIGIQYNISKEDNITRGKFIGKKFRSVIFSINDKIELDNGFQEKPVIVGDFIWEFIEEFITLKNKLNTYYDGGVGVKIENTRYNGYSFGIFFLTGEEEDKEYLDLKTLYNEIVSKYSSCKSEFCYSMIININDDYREITIKVDDYTNRKWKSFTGNIDLSKFEVNVVDIGQYYSTIITIKTKK